MITCVDIQFGTKQTHTSLSTFGGQCSMVLLELVFRIINSDFWTGLEPTGLCLVLLIPFSSWPIPPNPLRSASLIHSLPLYSLFSLLPSFLTFPSLPISFPFPSLSFSPSSSLFSPFLLSCGQTQLGVLVFTKWSAYIWLLNPSFLSGVNSLKYCRKHSRHFICASGCLLGWLSEWG